MTDARLRLAEAIARAHGERIGIYMPCEREWWLQPHVLEPILAAARECVAGEVSAELDAMTLQRAWMLVEGETWRALGDQSKCVSVGPLPTYPGLDGEPCERFERAGGPG